MPKYNKNQYSLKQAYAFYKKSVENPVTYKEYKLILDTWGYKVVEYLVQGKDVKLHNGMSLIGVRKRVKPTFINKKESKERGEVVRSSNIHAGFYGAYTFWRRHYTTFNSVGWVFRASRHLQKAIAAVMLQPEGHTRFLIRASAAGTQEQAINMYNKKVHKI